MTDRLLSVRQTSDMVIRYKTMHGKHYRAILDRYPQVRISRRKFDRAAEARAYAERFQRTWRRLAERQGNNDQIQD